jgi:hypothetical protein
MTMSQTIVVGRHSGCNDQLIEVLYDPPGPGF